jgi:hypothetical protein
LEQRRERSRLKCHCHWHGEDREQRSQCDADEAVAPMRGERGLRLQHGLLDDRGRGAKIANQHREVADGEHDGHETEVGRRQQAR